MNQPQIGETRGKRQVIAIAGPDRDGRKRVTVRCGCGRVSTILYCTLRKGNGYCPQCFPNAGGKRGRTWTVTCRNCGRKGHLAKTCPL